MFDDVADDRRSRYRCSFCSENLLLLPYRGWGRWRRMLPVRRYRCPHCFETVTRPVEWIGTCGPFRDWFRQSTASASADTSGLVLSNEDTIIEAETDDSGKTDNAAVSDDVSSAENSESARLSKQHREFSGRHRRRRHRLRAAASQINERSENTLRAVLRFLSKLGRRVTHIEEAVSSTIGGLWSRLKQIGRTKRRSSRSSRRSRRRSEKP